MFLVGGWVGGSKSHFMHCLQQSNTKEDLLQNLLNSSPSIGPLFIVKCQLQKGLVSGLGTQYSSGICSWFLNSKLSIDCDLADREHFETGQKTKLKNSVNLIKS